MRFPFDSFSSLSVQEERSPAAELPQEHPHGLRGQAASNGGGRGALMFPMDGHSGEELKEGLSNAVSEHTFDLGHESGQWPRSEEREFDRIAADQQVW